MATTYQLETSQLGGQFAVRQLLTLTMVAGAQTDVPFSIPVGAAFVRFQYLTPAAFSGSPTAINLSIGKTLGGQDYVANTNVAALAAPTACTLVNTTAADLASAPSQTWHATLTAAGGTNPAGTAYVLVEYMPPAGVA